MSEQDGPDTFRGFATAALPIVAALVAVYAGFETLSNVAGLENSAQEWLWTISLFATPLAVGFALAFVVDILFALLPETRWSWGDLLAKTLRRLTWVVGYGYLVLAEPPTRAWAVSTLPEPLMGAMDAVGGVSLFVITWWYLKVRREQAERELNQTVSNAVRAVVTESDVAESLLRRSVPDRVRSGRAVGRTPARRPRRAPWVRTRSDQVYRRPVPQ